MNIRERVGVHRLMPAREYHGLPSVSASLLRVLWSSTPAHCKLAMDSKTEATSAMRVGTLAHAMILEPFAEIPFRACPETYTNAKGEVKDWNWNATECKAWKADKVAAGCEICTAGELERAEAIRDAVVGHAIAGPIVQDAATEVSLVTWDTTNEIAVRCRVDLVPTGADFLADIKTTATLDGWGERKAYADGLHIQAALYLDVWNALTGQTRTGFRFIAVEADAPNDVRVYSCPPEFIEAGRTDYVSALKTFAECHRSGVWPGSPTKEYGVQVPKWRIEQ